MPAAAGAPAAIRAGSSREHVRRFAPYVVAALALGAILYRYDVREIAAHMASGRALAVAPFAVGLCLGLLPLVSTWDWMIVSRALGGPGYLDVARGKAGTAVLMTLGYAFGSGGYGVWLGRKTGAGVRATTGAVLYVALSDLAAVCLVATVPAWVADMPQAGVLRAVAPAVALVTIGLMLAAPRLARGRSLMQRGLLEAWGGVPGHRALLQILGRCANISLILVATWGAARAFGLGVPFVAMATYMPIILLVASLPVNVAGFGAVQGVWLLSFGAWAPGEQILAFNFTWHLFLGAAVVLRGLPFVRRVVAEIDEGRKAP